MVPKYFQIEYCSSCSILGASLLSERLDLSNACEEAELSLTLFSLPPMAHALSTGMLCLVAVLDWPRTFTTAVLENIFAQGWSVQSLFSVWTKVKTAHPFCTHSAPILHCYYCGLGNENCGGMSQLQPEQKAHCQPSRGLIIRSECRSSSFTDKCILNEKLITTCWNCSSIQRQLSAC